MWLVYCCRRFSLFFFFFNDTATTEIYTLSLHDALPIYWGDRCRPIQCFTSHGEGAPDRKSTRLNSSHLGISYAVFCLKKKKKNAPANTPPQHYQPPEYIVHRR